VDIGTLLSTILLVSFIVTIILAVGSYMAYKFRERRRPREATRGGDAPMYFERFHLPPSGAGSGQDAEQVVRAGSRRE
jgi:hypothetical protein